MNGPCRQNHNTQQGSLKSLLGVFIYAQYPQGNSNPRRLREREVS